MRLALIGDERRLAEPHARGRCPACLGDVIAKCGPINAWHWAHKTLDCDTWAEPFTQWHADWQEYFPPDSCEIVIGRHRADVQMPNGLVIEFQHSALSADEIRERENFYAPLAEGYGGMLWVFDAVDAYEADRLNLRRNFVPSERIYRGRRRGRHLLTAENYRSFRWKHPRRSILACRRPVWLDLGAGQLLELKKMYPNAPYGGWGYLWTTEAFLERCGNQFMLGSIT